MEFISGAGTGDPAVVMIVEGRARPGRKDSIIATYDNFPRVLHGLHTFVMRLQWDNDDPARFRGIVEYATENDFEIHDLRSRQDPEYLEFVALVESELESPLEFSIWRETNRQVAGDLVRAYWGLVDAGEFQGLRAVLAEDIVMEWPGFNERVVGMENVIKLNIAAPKSWVANVKWVIASGHNVASAAEVVVGTGPRYVLLTHWEIDGQRIRHATEFWCPINGAGAPVWRRRYAEPMIETRGPTVVA